MSNRMDDSSMSEAAKIAAIENALLRCAMGDCCTETTTYDETFQQDSMGVWHKETKPPKTTRTQMKPSKAAQKFILKNISKFNRDNSTVSADLPCFMGYSEKLN